jgi:hypothetical protein
MWWYDPDAANREECKYVREFRHLATEDILAHLTDTTTPEQYQVALECLLALKDELMGRVDAFHRSALYGRHWCIDDAYRSLRQKLQNAMVLRPVPQPAPPPAPSPAPPRPKRRSLADMLIQFAEEGSQTSEGEGNDTAPGIDE